jgi:hypothetical protein
LALKFRSGNGLIPNFVQQGNNNIYCYEARSVELCYFLDGDGPGCQDYNHIYVELKDMERNCKPLISIEYNENDRQQTFI